MTEEDKRQEWVGLCHNSDILHLLPKAALAATIRDLAEELLKLTGGPVPVPPADL